MLKIVVTAPYVMLKVKDLVTGGVSVREFYKGAILPDESNPDDVKRLLGKEMLAEQEFADPEPAVDPEREPEKDKGNGRPAGNASRDDWAAYAASKGAPEDETKPVDQGGLSRDDLRAKYGS